MHGQEAGAAAKNIIKRGLFIVFEGLDRSGKSTQSAKLTKYLSEEMQIKVKAINFPSKYWFQKGGNLQIMGGILIEVVDRESESGKMLN